MIHFNELYITEDEKHLVIDAEIDNLPIYNGCAIDTVTVSASPDCDKANMRTITVYDNSTDGSIIYDLNNDGKITYED